ncbi:hypothetical protein [Rahnella contaminans]|uniref:hypothetical protein n=1 Tax=Rahnella contaminans TaxID=2703882 RepID=UPI0023DCCD7E|nr:hypothetical protein [Rahnella contaminans]MDF1892881.1 hypothetical protein [Rahnella contaminans]
MEKDVGINYEEDYQALCREYELKFDQIKDQDNLSQAEVDSVNASGRHWASDFLRRYGENDIASHYEGALANEFEQICRQADRDKTRFGGMDIAVGLYTLGQIFRAQCRIREACRYLAIACGYLELNRDLSMLFNVAISDEVNREKEQQKNETSKAEPGIRRKFELVRQKVIQLLETTERPEQGWQRNTLAFKAIDGALWQFIEEEGIDLEYSELRTRVLRWSRERDNVREAFARVVAQKKK